MVYGMYCICMSELFIIIFAIDCIYFVLKEMFFNRSNNNNKWENYLFSVIFEDEMQGMNIIILNLIRLFNEVIFCIYRNKIKKFTIQII